MIASKGTRGICSLGSARKEYYRIPKTGMPKSVSVIVITYNARKDLEECLESIEKQGYHEIEIIVVNDASKDSTSNFLEEYKRRTTKKLEVINNEHNKGVAGSRNTGIQFAKGDIVAFTDADCVVDHQWISELVKGYEQKDVAAVGGEVLESQIRNIWELTDKGHDFVAQKEGFVSYIVGCNMSFQGDVLKRFMFNDEIKYGYEEALLCDSLIEMGHKIYFRPQAVVYHKRRNSLKGLATRKYRLGVGSIWYKKRQKKPLLFKRHVIFLLALLVLPFSIVSLMFFYGGCALLLIFIASLLRDELIFKKKNALEVIITLPFIVFIELFHFLGSCAGLIKFCAFGQKR